MVVKPLRVLFTLSILMCCIQAILNPLRLLGIFNMSYVNLFIIYAIGALAFLIFIDKVRKLSLIETVLVILVLGNIFFAIVKGNDTFKIFTNLIRPLFFFSLIKAFALIDIGMSSKKLPLKQSADWLIFSYAIGVLFVAFIYFTVGGVRASSSAIPLALPLFYFFFHRQYSKVFICAGLFLLGGKFGPLVGVLCALFFTFGLSPRRLILVGTTLGAVLIALGVLSHFEFINFWKIPVFAKFNFGTLVEKGFGMDILDRYVLGGRLSEAYSAIIGLGESGGKLGYWLFAGGLGYSYLWSDFAGVIIREQNTGVHFTPIAIFCVYGLPFAVLMLSYLFKYFLKSVVILKNHKIYTPSYLIWPAFFIASFVNMFTAYSLFTNLLMAVSIGMIQRNGNNHLEYTGLK
jgi:hypothetical protein